MTKVEYHEKLDAIQKKCKEKETALRKEFVMANKKYDIGDIVGDSHHIIEIEDIMVSRISIYPSAVYRGIRLNKALQPFKSGEREGIWEGSVVSHFPAKDKDLRPFYNIKGQKK